MMADPVLPCCPRCHRPLHHRAFDPAFYPGKEYTYLCDTIMAGGVECHQKIVMEMRH